MFTQKFIKMDGEALRQIKVGLYQRLVTQPTIEEENLILLNVFDILLDSQLAEKHGVVISDFTKDNAYMRAARSKIIEQLSIQEYRRFESPNASQELSSTNRAPKPLSVSKLCAVHNPVSGENLLQERKAVGSSSGAQSTYQSYSNAVEKIFFEIRDLAIKRYINQLFGENQDLPKTFQFKKRKRF